MYSKNCRHAKISYYQKIFDVKSSTTNKIWKHLNELLGKRISAHSNTIDKLIYKDKAFHNDVDIANAFNQYFVNVGSSLADALPPSNITFQSYLSPPISNSIYVDPITTVEVFNLISNTSGGKAAGDDGFNLELIKNNALCLVYPLTHIYNVSLFTGTVPKAFKKAKVIPIFKKGDAELPGNYRPISLLSVFNKLLEKLIGKRLLNFFDSEHIL